VGLPVGIALAIGGATAWKHRSRATHTVPAGVVATSTPGSVSHHID
jgi:hypothetical protein